jgi:hypothetical protein
MKKLLRGCGTMKNKGEFRFRKKKDDKLQKRFYDVCKYENIEESELIRNALYCYLFKEQNEFSQNKVEKIKLDFEFENTIQEKEISEEVLDNGIDDLLGNF